MNPIRQLRQQLDRLEDALQTAGLALLQAEETANEEELRELLLAYGIDNSRNRKRLEWLKAQGAMLRWHEGQSS